MINKDSAVKNKIAVTTNAAVISFSEKYCKGIWKTFLPDLPGNSIKIFCIVFYFCVARSRPQCFFYLYKTFIYFNSFRKITFLKTAFKNWLSEFDSVFDKTNAKTQTNNDKS